MPEPQSPPSVAAGASPKLTSVTDEPPLSESATIDKQESSTKTPKKGSSSSNHHVVLVSPDDLGAEKAEAIAQSDLKLGDPPADTKTIAINLSWEDLSYTIGEKPIISRMTGRLIAGRTCAVMGLSGSGKTTLLNALCGRLSTTRHRVLKGRVRLNDVPYDRRYRQLIGYVPQQDIIGPMSTPRTAFKFALRTRRGVSQAEATETVHKYIEKLNLLDCRNTIAGTPGVVQGLSGGERKRTNIGMELIADTKLLLCDEPTSGLDSTTALMVVQTLQNLAHNDGCTVMFTAHQPTTEMLEHFDDILLMSGGKTVYHGPMDKSVDYFESLGYECPSNFTPTDFYMVLLQNDEIAPQLLAKWNEYLELNKITVETARSPMNTEPFASPLSTAHNNEPIDEDSEDDNDDENNDNNNKSSSKNERPKKKEENKKPVEADRGIESGNEEKSQELESIADDETEVRKGDKEGEDGDKGTLGVKRTKTENVAKGDDLKCILGDEPPLNVIPYPASSASNNDDESPSHKGSHHHHHHHNSPTRLYLKEYLATYGSSYWIQIIELFKRSFVFVYTDYSYLGMLIISHLFFAVIVAIIFNNLTDNATGVQDRIGLLFMCATNVCFSHANFALNRFRTSKLLYIREQQVGSYSPAIYFLATFTADLPILALCIMLKSIIVYFATGLYGSAGAFFYFFIVLFLLSVASFGFGALVGTAISNEVIATSVVPMIQVPMLMCGGLLADNDQIRPYFIWLEKISVHRYGSLLLFHNEFSHLGELSCDPALFGVTGCALQPKRGSDVIPFLGFDDEQDSEWVMWISLAAFIFLIRFGQLVAFYVIAHGKY